MSNGVRQGAPRAHEGIPSASAGGRRRRGRRPARPLRILSEREERRGVLYEHGVDRCLADAEALKDLDEPGGEPCQTRFTSE